ncbi:hypothetical protein H0G86_010647 [Trichoderma simmonsii]|uniref:Uncharacterized protein n=1 Tax=Trichoderma simmonsii TaxID=1491479 RepID=A0A8G0LPW3_9HYPO|nr:hypothetical protein H0G86_010647 [Trichoderma simmonsii]
MHRHSWSPKFPKLPRYPHHVTVPVDASLLLTFHSTPKQTRILSLLRLDSKYLQLIASPIIIFQRCLFVFAPPPSCADVLDRRFSDDISNLPTRFHLHLDSTIGGSASPYDRLLIHKPA